MVRSGKVHRWVSSNNTGSIGVGQVNVPSTHCCSRRNKFRKLLWEFGLQSLIYTCIDRSSYIKNRTKRHRGTLKPIRFNVQCSIDIQILAQQWPVPGPSKLSKWNSVFRWTEFVNFHMYMCVRVGFYWRQSNRTTDECCAQLFRARSETLVHPILMVIKTERDNGIRKWFFWQNKSASGSSDGRFRWLGLVVLVQTGGWPPKKCWQPDRSPI